MTKANVTLFVRFLFHFSLEREDLRRDFRQRFVTYRKINIHLTLNLKEHRGISVIKLSRNEIAHIK